MERIIGQLGWYFILTCYSFYGRYGGVYWLVFKKQRLIEFAEFFISRPFFNQVFISIWLNTCLKNSGLPVVAGIRFKVYAEDSKATTGDFYDSSYL